MKQSLQLRLGQHLAMTPRLQQAIRLLQLSTVELHTEVQEALDSNLMLEPDEDDAAGASPEAEIPPADIPRELPVDSVWEDIYDSVSLGGAAPIGEPDGADLVRPPGPDRIAEGSAPVAGIPDGGSAIPTR